MKILCYLPVHKQKKIQRMEMLFGKKWQKLKTNKEENETGQKRMEILKLENNV